MTTDKNPKPTLEPTGNLTEVKELIAEKYAEIEAAKKARGTANAGIAENLTALEAKGIPKEAMRMAMRYHDWDDDKRRGFDIAYHVAREALGNPIQRDMFDGETE